MTETPICRIEGCQNPQRPDGPQRGPYARLCETHYEITRQQASQRMLKKPRKQVEQVARSENEWGSSAPTPLLSSVAVAAEPAFEISTARKIGFVNEGNLYKQIESAFTLIGREIALGPMDEGPILGVFSFPINGSTYTVTVEQQES